MKDSSFTWAGFIITVVFSLTLKHTFYRGVTLAQSVNNKQLKKECASILETLKVGSAMFDMCVRVTLPTPCTQLYAEAATLYEGSDSWDKATSVYMKGKNW